MLCFVTVGTTKFDKLIETVLSEECLQKLSSIGVDQMRIQYGAGRLPPEREQSENEGAVFTTNNIQIECYRFKPSLREDMKAADLIIGHAGAGTCLEVIQMGKPFIVIINELLMDNHQCELAEQLGIMECLLYTVCRDLAETLTHPSLFRLKKYPSGNPKAITDFIKSRLGFL